MLGVSLVLASCRGDAPKTPAGADAVACTSAETCRTALAAAARDDRPVGPALVALAAALDREGKPALARATDAAAEAPRALLAITTADDGPFVEAVFTDAGIAPERVLEGLGELAKAEQVILRRGAETTRLYVRDPLRHEMGTLPATTHTPARSKADADVTFESALRKLFALAQQNQMVAAVPAADALAAQLDARDPFDLGSLRARLLLRRLPFSVEVKPLPPGLPAGTTPYEALLLSRLDLATDAYAKRRATILRGFPEEEHALVDELFLEGACPSRITPSFERPHDLFYAPLLSRRLLPTQARGKDERLTIDAWHERYARLVERVSDTRTGFLFVTSLMRERGQSAGVLPQASRAFQRASAIAASHVAGLTEVVIASPERVGMEHTTFLLAPGFMLDTENRARAVALAGQLGEAAIVKAKDSEEMLFAVLSSILSLAMLPPEVHEANLAALERAVEKRLAGDMQKQTGWDVALLYGIDGAYRLIAKRGGDPSRSASEIQRALAGPGVPSPELARVAGLVAAYGALGFQGGLGAPVPNDKEILPARKRLKDQLTEAIRSLGTPKDRAEAKLATDLADVLDGLIATIILDFGEQQAGATDAAMCAKDGATHGPRVARALAILADRRNNLLKAAGLRTAEGTPAADSPFVTRTRALAVIASDVIDVYRKKDGKIAFAVPEARGREALRRAVGDVAGDAKIGALAAGSYAFLRAIVSGDTEFFRGKDASRALGDTFEGLAALLADETAPDRGVAAVFRQIARAQSTQDDLGKALALAAKERFGQGQPDQADTMLLVGLAVTALRRGVLPDELVAVADGEKSRLAFALRFMRRIQELNAGTRAAAPGDFESEMRAAFAAKCTVVSDEAIEGAFRGVEQFAAGKRKEARDELRKVIDASKRRGLALPVYTYSVRDTTATHDFVFSLGIGSAGGFLSAHTFQVGLGIRTHADPYYGVTTFASDSETAEARLSEGRYVVAITGLLAAYAFLDGDLAEADRAAAELVGALTQQSQLTQHPQAGNPAMLIDGNIGIVARVATLATKHQRPLLAGALLSIVEAQLRGNDVHTMVEDILDDGPLGLREPAAILDGLDKDTRRILGRLESKLCPDKTAQEGPPAVSCNAYAEAVALRIVDARKTLPTLESPESCPSLRALDRFLTGMQRGSYDPDALVAAAEQAAQDQRAFDAAVLLTKHRNPTHCSPAIVERLRKVAHAPETAASSKADLVASIVNCGLSTGQGAVDDLLELDATLAAVGDPMRAFEALLYASGVAGQDAAPLYALLSQKDYAERYRGFDPNIRVLVAALGEIASALTQKPAPDLVRPTELALICDDESNTRRKDLCGDLQGLRQSAKTSAPGSKERREHALRTLSRMLQQPP